MLNNDDNTCSSLTIPKDLKIKLDIIAKSDHMSVDNLVFSVLNNYVNDEFENEQNNME